MKFGVLVNRYIVNHTLTAGTIEHLHLASAQFERHLRRKVLVSDLSAQAINGFIHSRLARGLSPRSVRRERQNLMSLWKFAYSQGLTRNQPGGVAPIKVPKTRHPTWTEGEFQKILAACHTAPDAMGFEPKHWIALINFLADTGLQVSRALKLDDAALDLDRGVVLVPASGSAKGARQKSSGFRGDQSMPSERSRDMARSSPGRAPWIGFAGNIARF